MKIEQINEFFINSLNLIDFGFEYIDYNFDYNQGLLIHQINEKQNILSYSYGYNYKDLSHFEFGANSFKSFINLIEVEKILQKIIGYSAPKKIKKIEDFRLLNFHSNAYTIINSQAIESENITIYKNEKFVLENIDFLIENSLSTLKLFHLPFFRRVKDLQYINDEIIDKVPQTELGNYIPGKYMNPKKLIIMKLCNNPKYEEFKNWLIEIFEQVIETNPESYLDDYNTVKATIEFLESERCKEVI